MKNRLYAYFDFDSKHAYPVVNGAIYTDNENEEIDSITLKIDGVSKINIDRPYHFVKIVNDIPDGETGFMWKDINGEYVNYTFMLIDNWVETLTNIDNQIYRYEINLMNSIKFFEKVQCPNRIITHSLVNGSKTIYEYINEYMLLYCPKVKMSTDGENWSYEYLFKWDNLNVHPFNDTVCADMQMNEPTLRQLLTNLMIQVGCIPTVFYRTLSFINFRETQENAELTNDDGHNFISNSDASDSYSTTLVASPNQALDSENEVIAEKVGFRDRDNAVISQSKNLQLETRYPIYKINKVLVRDVLNTSLYYKINNENNKGKESFYPILNGYHSTYVDYRPKLKYVDTAYGEVEWELEMNFTYYQRNTEIGLHKGTLERINIHFCNYDSNDGSYSNDFTYVISAGRLFPIPIQVPARYDLNIGDSTDDKVVILNNERLGFELSEDGSIIEDPLYALNTNATCNYKIFRTIHTDAALGTDFRNIYSHIWFESVFVDKVTGEEYYQFIPMSRIVQKTANSVYVFDIKVEPNEYNDNKQFTDLYGAIGSQTIDMNTYLLTADKGAYVDITKLIVENSRRKLLENDYTTMMTIVNDTNNIYTMDDFAKYIYATMGYTIGDTKITGFSETYTRAQMWWNITQTYFDNVLEFITNHKNVIDYDFEITNRLIAYSEKYGDMPLRKECLRATSGRMGLTDVPAFLPANAKSNFFFDIYYQPLSNVKLRITKEKDEPVRLEQLNNTNDGLNDFYRLMKHNQENANRVGNIVKSIPQVIDDMSKLKPLNGLIDGYTIFRRKIEIQNNYLSVLYNCSESYVIKNYFTSIITKYRAYEYVDYNASVVRKENTKIYAYLSADKYYDGDDHLVLQGVQRYSFDDLANLLGVDVADINDYITYDLYNSNPTYVPRILFDLSIGYYFYYNNTRTNTYNKITVKTDGSSVTGVKTPADPNYIFNPLYSCNFPVNVYSGDVVINEMIRPRLVKRIKNNVDNILDEVLEYYRNNSSLGNIPLLNLTQYYALSKMNDGVLYDDIYDKYYRIQVVEDPYNSQRKDVVGVNTPADTSGLENLRSAAEGAIQGISYVEMYGGIGYFGVIDYLYNGVYIYLKEITEEEALENDKEVATIFLSGLETHLNGNRIKHTIEIGTNSDGNYEETLSECSTLIYGNGYCFNYQDYDNVSAGPYFKQDDVDSSVGGLVQEWQIWDTETYNEKHQVIYAYAIEVTDEFREKYEATLVSKMNELIRELPIITKGWEYKPYSYFQLVDNNKSGSLDFTFYKDNAEIINQTLQIEYYSDKDILVGRNFSRNNRLVNAIENTDSSRIVWFDITNEKFVLEEQPYEKSIDEHYLENPNSQRCSLGYESNGIPYIEVKWSEINSSITQIKFAIAEPRLLKYFNCYDLIAFKRNGHTEDTKYYLTLNDTKTNEVWYFSDPDDLFETRECKNGLERKLKSI